MRMERKYKPERIASKDTGREVLTHLCVDIHNDQTVVAATDGRRLVCVPCEIDSIHEIGLMPVEAVKEARNLKVKRLNRDEVSVPLAKISESFDSRLATRQPFEINKDNVHITIDKPSETLVYPKWTQVIPTGESKFTITLNAKLLSELADALGSDGVVTLQFRDPSDVIHVTADKRSGAFGLLMPCHMP